MNTNVTATQQAILEALATYRLLTAQQMHTLDVSKNLRHIYASLRELCPKKERSGGVLGDQPQRAKRRDVPIDYLEFGSERGRGSRADVWYLTRAGTHLLAELNGDLEPIRVPAKVEPYSAEYEHRCHTVDFHIALRTYARRARFNVDFAFTYFGRGDERYRTRVPYQIEKRPKVIVPDMVFMLTSPSGIKRLYAFEMYEGRRTLRASERLLAYMYPIDQEAIEKAFGYGEGSVQVLAVLSSLADERLVRERLAKEEDFADFAPLFFFKTLAEVKADFRQGWRQVGTDKTLPLF